MLKEQGDFNGALAGFRESIRLKPGLSSPSIGLAWMLAAHPNSERRDPAEAVRIAERIALQSDYKNWLSLDALGVAYAAAGRFEEAQKAIPFAQATGATNAAAVDSRRRLYLARHPFVEAGPRRVGIFPEGVATRFSLRLGP